MKKINKIEDFALKIPEIFLGQWVWPWVSRDTGNDEFSFRLICAGHQIIDVMTEYASKTR